MNATEQTQRQEYIAGLRALADVLESTPDLILPTAGTSSQRVHWVTSWEPDPKAATTSVVRAVGGKWDKKPGGRNDEIMVLHGSIRGLFLEVLVGRERVCERVITGQRHVIKTVPTATEEVTVIEDVVEWVCSPLLADAVSS